MMDIPKVWTMPKARRGVFGGTAGLWLLRKKNKGKSGQSESGQVDPPCKVRRRGTSSETRKQVDSKQIPTPEGAQHDSRHCQEGSLSVVRDDGNCRAALIRDKSDDQASAATHASLSTSGVSDFSTSPIVDSGISPSSNYPKQSTISISSMKQQRRRHRMTDIKGSRHRNRRGVFNVQKRRCVVITETKDESLSSSDETNSLGPRPMKRICIRKASMNDSFDPPSLEIGKSRSPQTDTQCDLESASADGSDSTSRSDNSSASAHDVPSLTQKSESSSIFDFAKNYATGSKADDSHHQSIEAARAFFAKLDSDPTLLNLEDVLSGQEPCSGRKKTGGAIATTRGKLPPHVVQSEYRKYRTVCREAKIKPLTLKCFLEQRSVCYRSGDIYDGMFDE